MHRDERITAIAAMFDCAPALAAQVEPSMQAVSFAHKAVLAHQGDSSEHCWLVIGGTVHIQVNGIDGQRVQLAYHGPGEFFGAYPEPATHRADMVAHGAVDLLRIRCTELAALAHSQPALAAGLARRLARQLDLSLDRMAAQTTLSAPGRIHAELLRLADADYRIVPAPQITALALNANTARETASRAVSALERRGIVERSERGLTILAPRMLRDMIY
ncbi:Crp/Fnr family transcriptional regulator [Novosphingobium sp. LASN5T]|nr:Crp/Fnr family transcriptional regulator [Novosphingobium sp. LASN5T]